MKNKFLILTLLGLFLVSCSDQLDRAPIDALDATEAFQSVPDLEFGMYGFVGSYNPNTLVAHNSIFTDNIKLGLNNGGQELNALNQILNADTGDRGMWNSRYGTINDINRVLEAAVNILPASDDEIEPYDNVRAQAYAFRALAHWELLLYYGFDVTNSGSDGVPYVDYVSLDELPARNTVGEVLSGIEADLTAASNLLTNVTPDISYATQDFITFLRARIALETGNYDGAINFASQIISAYPLADRQQYLAMYNEDADLTEVIWRYDNAQGFNRNLAGTWIFTASGTSSESGFMEMGNGLVNAFEPGFDPDPVDPNDPDFDLQEAQDAFQPNDVRLKVCYDVVSDFAGGEILIGKYPPNGDTQYINDFKAMRVSEAYLIRAEAYARNQQLGLAGDDVVAVRGARLATGANPVSYDSQVEAMEDILAERRLELAFEGHRYTDIKRMRDVLNTGIVRDEADCPGGVPCVLEVDSEKWIFPVPNTEVNANPNILPQAPGYGN